MAGIAVDPDELSLEAPKLAVDASELSDTAPDPLKKTVTKPQHLPSAEEYAASHVTAQQKLHELLDQGLPGVAKPPTPTGLQPAPGILDTVKLAAQGLPAMIQQGARTPILPLSKIPAGDAAEVVGNTLIPGAGTLVRNNPIAQGVGAGAAEVVEGLSTPSNLLMMAGGLGGAAVLPKVGRFLPKAISTYFSATMLKDAYDRIPAVKEAVEKKDWARAAKEITAGVASGVMGTAAGVHAFAGHEAAPTVAEATESVKQGVKAVDPEELTAAPPTSGGIFQESDKIPPVPRATVGESGKTRETPGNGKPIWEMSPKELDAAHAEAKGRDKADLVELFGEEGSKQYGKLERTANSTTRTDAETTAAQNALDAMQAKLTEPQRNRLFGIGDERPQAEDIAEQRSALGRLDFSSPEALGESLKWAVTAIGDKQNPAEMTGPERVRYNQLRHGMAEADRLGFDREKVSAAALRGAAERFRPEDVATMLKRFAGGAERPIEQSALESPAGTPGTVAAVEPNTIKLDPARFQFKSNTGQKGVTDQFKELKTFDPEKAGVVAVWTDPKDGETYAVNGHHRTELAQRTEAPSMNVLYLDAKNAQEARTKGALINIAEGQGTAVDAAKVFRDSGLDRAGLEKENISLKGEKARQGLALANLDPHLFSKVIEGDLSVNRGVILGEGLASHEDQRALHDTAESGKHVTDAQLAEMIRLSGDTPKTTETQESLFGNEEVTRSLIREKAEVSDYIRRRLGQEKKLFTAVGNEGAAEQLSSSGNVIKADENARVAERAGQAGAIYDKLSTSSGPVSESLNSAATLIANGENGPSVKERAYKQVRDFLVEQADRLTGKGQRPDGGSQENALPRASEAGAGERNQTVAAPAKPAEEKPQPAAETPRLPAALSGAKPRYAFGPNQFELKFKSDLDKAAYITAQATRSKQDAGYLKFVMDHTGMGTGQVRLEGARVRAMIKSLASRMDKGGVLEVPERLSSKSTALFDRATEERSATAAASDKAKLTGDRLTAQFKAPISREEQVAKLKPGEQPAQESMFEKTPENPQGSMFGPDFSADEKDRELTLHRGTGIPGQEGNYYSTDREWAKQFTRSGRDSEVRSIKVPADKILDLGKDTPKAYGSGDDDFAPAIEKAKAAGALGFYVDEGQGEPRSVWFLKPPGRERGGINPELLGSKFVEKDIIPAARRIAGDVAEARDQALRIFAPTARDSSAEFTGLTMRQRMAQFARRYAQGEKRLRTAETFFNNRTPEENYRFIDNVEKGLGRDNAANRANDEFFGSQPGDKELKPIAMKLSGMLDQRRKEVQALGEGALDRFYTNYFPHLFERPTAAIEYVNKFFGDKANLEGSAAFLKRRDFPTFKEALDAGLKPVSDNPIQLVMMKAREMDRYLLAHHTLRDLGDRGIAVRVPAPNEEVPERLQKYTVPTKNDVPAGMTEIANLFGGARWYAEEGAAGVLNNYLNPGLRQKSGAYRILSGINNVMNQANLGLSAFHLTGEIIRSGVSRAALGIEDLANGKPIRGSLRIASFPAGPFIDYVKGSKVLREYFKPGSEGAPIAAITDALMKGGGRATEPQEFATHATRSLMKAVHEHNYVGAGLRLPLAALEKVSSPLMTNIIPRLKLGVFAGMAANDIEKLGPGASVIDVQRAMAKAWDATDDRMGQMVYDNLFWNKTAKDVLHLTVRSVGWNLGSLRGHAMGAVDLKNLALRKPGADFSHRIAWNLALPLVSAVIGASYMYLHTGKGPQKPKDYFFPKREDGQRYAMPTDIKDIYHWSTDPLRTAEDKTGPLINTIVEILHNRDYYNRPIVDTEDPYFTQGKDFLQFLGRQMAPFTMQQYMGGKKAIPESNPEHKAEGYLGITKASKDIQREGPAPRRRVKR